MGLMGTVLGMGRVAERVGGVAEVFVGNQAERDAADLERATRTLEQFKGEFEQTPDGFFDRFVNAMNRVPRPLLSLGIIGLFIYAMIEPAGFSERMEGLALVPEPLWWLMGAVVSFYFGARELHHFRNRGTLTARALLHSGETAASVTAEAPVEGVDEAAPFFGGTVRRLAGGTSTGAVEVAVRASDPDFNAPLEEWRRSRR